MNRKQVLNAIAAVAAFSAITTAAQAADVQSILGRGAPVGGVKVETILVTGKSVNDVQGRAGYVATRNATAKFAVGNAAKRAAGEALVNRQGRV